MTPSGPDDFEQRLRALRERQAELAAAGQGDSAAMRALAREIVAVAAGLGFDPEEAAGIASQIEAPASGPGHAMAGEYRVLRGSAEPILTFSALVIAGAVYGLGQPVAGALIVVATLASWFIRGAGGSPGCASTPPARRAFRAGWIGSIRPSWSASTSPTVIRRGSPNTASPRARPSTSACT